MSEFSENPLPGAIPSYKSARAGKLICEPLRAGKYVVVGDEATLPRRCVLCNRQAADPPVLFKIPPRESIFQYLGISRTSGKASKIGFIFNPRAHVLASFCPRHYRKRQRAVLLAICSIIGVVLASIFVIYAKQNAQTLHDLYLWSGRGVAAALLLMLVFAVATVEAARGPRCHPMEGGYYYLEGFGKAFLRSLPEAPLQKGS